MEDDRNEHGEGLRVLIVDDNEDVADAMVDAVSDLGRHQAKAVYSASDALETTSRWKPHLAIIDIGLPRMDGYELAETMREQQPAPPRLVALSGYGQAEDRARSRTAGFERHLVKPVSLKQIWRVLDEFEQEVGSAPEADRTDRA